MLYTPLKTTLLLHRTNTTTKNIY